jgi:hypothetical protein
MSSVFVPLRAARACGGGVVTLAQAGTIGSDAQRILISVRGNMTDVITQIGVPATTAEYGVLIPVPSQPTLDPTAVAAADIDALYGWTAPKLVEPAASDDSILSCGCPVKSGDAGGSGNTRSVQVSAPVSIGPVTAVTLTADTGDAINAWLADNGFVIPAASQSTVDAYAGPGRYFIAIRRNDTAATGGATSVGVHFTLAGDERGLPLRFARIGAGEVVGFTVLVAADGAMMGPSAPYGVLTLNDLDRTILHTSGYTSALSSAIARRANRAFVIEGFWPGSALSGIAGWPSLRQFFAADQTVTRLSALLPASTLDTDVVFDQPFTGAAPDRIYVHRTGTGEGRPKLAFAAALLAFATIARRQRPIRSPRPAKRGEG